MEAGCSTIFKYLRQTPWLSFHVEQAIRRFGVQQTDLSYTANVKGSDFEVEIMTVTSANSV